ncbi:hypothetical protein BSLG_003325 [Batrachochytrium salamandrivorans]|nr:hypothetical protein BSLG_003325 [Batrachochytrium salamandrivorans]
MPCYSQLRSALQGLQTQTSLCQDALNMWQTASTWLFASIPLLPWIPVDQLCGLFLWITSLLSRLDVRIGIAALVVPHVLAKMTLVTSESVLVFRDMGIQLHTRCWGGFVSTTRFIPVSKILTVIINEGITLFQVKFYLAILVDGEDEMTVAFSCAPKNNNYLNDELIRFRVEDVASTSHYRTSLC